LLEKFLPITADSRHQPPLILRGEARKAGCPSKQHAAATQIMLKLHVEI